MTLFFIKTIIKSIILPPGCLLLFFVVAYLLRNKKPRIAKFLGLGTGLLLYLLSTPLVGFLLNRVSETLPPVSHQAVHQFEPQAIVLLGGGGDPHSPEYGGRAFASRYTMLRTALAAHWAKKTELPILVSGGLGCNHGHTEAEGMRTALETYDLEVEWAEGESTNTHANAVMSKVLLEKDGITRILLVTSASHVSRAKLEFEAQGFEVLVAPVDFIDLKSGPFYIYSVLPDSTAFADSCDGIKALLAIIKLKLL